MSFTATDEDIKRMFARENKARVFYSQKIRDKKDFKSDFYKDEEESS